MSKVEKESAETTAVAVTMQSALPAFYAEEDFNGAGFEGADKDSYAIPFLTILQKMSPMCDEDAAEYVQGAKAGMIYNTVTGELNDGKKGIIIVPCAYHRSFIQWGGREGDSKGFKGEFTPDAIDKMKEEGEIVEFEGKLYKPDSEGKVHEKKSDRYQDTRAHYVLVVAEDGSVSQALLSLASTQIKASKTLMMALSQKKVDTPRGKMTPPSFANLVRFTTIGKSNDSGSWSAAKFDLEGMVTDQYIYSEAKAFYKSINEGSVKVDYEKSGGAAADEVADKF